MNRRSDGSSDLISGLAAAATFIVFFAAVHTPLWLSVLLSIGVYAGIRLLSPAAAVKEKRVDAAASLADAAAQTDRIAMAARQIPADDVRSAAGDLCSSAGRLIDYLRRNPDAASDALFLLKDSLTSVETYLTRFAALGSAQAKESREQILALLHNAGDRSHRLLDKLAGQDDAALAQEIKLQTETQKEMDVLLLRDGDDKQ